MKIRQLSAGIIAALLVTACGGPNHNAKSLVKDFVKENMVNPGDYDLVIEKVDTTRYISKDKVETMRKTTHHSGLYKQGIKYEVGETPQTLTYANVRITDKKDKNNSHVETFYFDKDVTRVIAFK